MYPVGMSASRISDAISRVFIRSLLLHKGYAALSRAGRVYVSVVRRDGIAKLTIGTVWAFHRTTNIVLWITARFAYVVSLSNSNYRIYDIFYAHHSPAFLSFSNNSAAAIAASHTFCSRMSGAPFWQSYNPRGAFRWSYRYGRQSA